MLQAPARCLQYRVSNDEVAIQEDKAAPGVVSRLANRHVVSRNLEVTARSKLTLLCSMSIRFAEEFCGLGGLLQEKEVMR